MLNNTVLITGASRGIGLSIAQSFSDEGFYVIGTSRSKFDLETALGTKDCSHIKLDVTDRDTIKEVYEQLKNENNLPGILINNAGKIYSQPIVKLTSGGFKSHNYKIWKNILDLNLNSVFLFSSKIIENFCNNRTKGLIINISSISAKEISVNLLIQLQNQVLRH